MESGVDPLQLLKEVGLPRASLTMPDLMVPSHKILKLFNLAAERANLDDFGLRLARTRHLGHLGAVGLLMREQPTVGKALEALTANFWAHAQGLSIRLKPIDKIVILSVNIWQPEVASVRQTTEVAMTVITNILRRFLSPVWAPEMVMFRHGKPRSLALHVDVFGVAPVFDQELDAIVLRANDLAVPIPGSDDRFAAQLSQYLELTAGQRSRDFTEEVRHEIQLLLAGGGAEADRVAQTLGVDRRTLHRHLVAQGTSYRSLLQDERVRLARAYLDAENRSLTQVSDLLGFSSLNAFSRWKRHALAIG